MYRFFSVQNKFFSKFLYYWINDSNLFFQDILKNLQLKTEPVNGQIKSEKEEKTDEKNSPLNWLADVALSNEDKKNSCGVCILCYT